MSIEMVPYTNFHDLNLDWMLKVVKTASDRLDTMDESIADAAGSAEAAAASAADADSAAQSAAAQAVTAAGHANAAATYAENAASSYNDTYDLYQDISGTVGQAATDWLEDHITQETGYVIDDTLTVQGAAADAKAAGDRLTAVEGQAAGTALGLSIIQMDMAVVKGNFADEYSNDTSVLYAVGDYCVRNNLFFRCVTATTGGNWDSSAWEMTTVGNEIQNVQDDAAAAVAAATVAQQSAAQASGAASSAANAASTAANAATTAANSASTAASAATNAANSASAATTAAANAASAASTATAAAAEAAASAESINIDTITEMIYNAYPHDTASGAVASFPDGANGIPLIALNISIEPSQSGSGTPAPDNIRFITGHTACEVYREAAYDSTADPQITINLGQTIYGGVVDMVGGKVIVNKITYAFNGTEGQWNKSSTYRGSFYRSWNIMPSGAGAPQGTFICSHADYVSNISDYAYSKCASDSSLNLWLMQDPDATINDFMAYLAEQYANGTPVTVCYTLATPITIDIPEAYNLTTLLGQNYIWSDSGAVSVEYRADTTKYIDKVIS